MNIWPFSSGDTLKSRQKHKEKAEETAKSAREAANQLREAILKATADTSERQDDNGR